MSLNGKYTMTSSDNMEAFMRALGATDEVLAGFKAKAATPGGMSYTMESSNADGYTFVDSFGKRKDIKFGVEREEPLGEGMPNRKVVVKKVNDTTMERVTTYPTGMVSTDMIVHKGDTVEVTSKAGDVTATATFKRS